MKTTTSKRAIMRMGYPERLRKYHAEKDDLFYRLHEMTPAEIEAENKRLIEKWRI